jgi:hypothetical protein
MVQIEFNKKVNLICQKIFLVSISRFYQKDTDWPLVSCDVCLEERATAKPWVRKCGEGVLCVLGTKPLDNTRG